MRVHQLFANKSANGTGPVQWWMGGMGTFHISGSLGGGSIAIEFRPDATSDFEPVLEDGSTAYAITVTGTLSIGIAVGQVRLNLTGATNPAVSVVLKECKG